MEPTDITIEILKGIREELHDGLRGVRDEVQGVREEVLGVREEVRGVSKRLDRLEQRQTEADVRVATELVAVVGAVREMRDAFLEDRSLRARVDDHERRLSAIEKHAE
jgi:hypothetical protein